jgi:hypothetical protein
MISYERGIDRLCDAEILDDHQVHSQFGFVFNPKPGREHHCVIIDEVFEAYTTCFSVNYPDPDISDEMVLIGHHIAIPTLPMSRDTEATAWMPNKYGEAKQPFKITVLMPNINSGVDGQWKKDSVCNEILYEY